MKSPLLLFIVALFFGTEIFGQNASQLASEGQRAYLANDVETAKAKFGEALSLDPKNTTATGYMRMIKAQEAKAGSGNGDMEKQLRALVLPEVKFKDASFGTALEYLKQAAAKQSVAVSFVVQADVDREAKVTLSLTGVPFLEALRYLCELGGTKFSVERFAVVVKKA